MLDGEDHAMLRTPALLLSLTLWAGLAQAQAPAADDAAARERLAKQIETEVIAPCCWSQQVSVHQSPAADEMRTDIRRRLEAGQSHDEIIAAYVAQYGDRIMAVPPARGFNRLLFVIPPVLLLGTAALVVVVVRRFTVRQETGGAPAAAAAGSDPYARRLEDELRDMD
jgi:cytochrome c-type biogenesis protein CcmH